MTRFVSERPDYPGRFDERKEAGKKDEEAMDIGAAWAKTWPGSSTDVNPVDLACHLGSLATICHSQIGEDARLFVWEDDG